MAEQLQQRAPGDPMLPRLAGMALLAVQRRRQRPGAGIRRTASTRGRLRYGHGPLVLQPGIALRVCWHLRSAAHLRAEGGSAVGGAPGAALMEARAPYSAGHSARPVTRADVDAVLTRLESRSVEDANLLRAYLAMLEGQVRVYRLGDELLPDDAFDGVDLDYAGAVT